MYYATERRPVGDSIDSNGINNNGTSLYAQIFIHLATPISGPVTGGTVVTVPGK